MNGRELFQATLGATLVLNPNDEWCYLYPEEVQTLLTSGYLVPIEKVQSTEARELLVNSRTVPPPGLLAALAESYARLPLVESGYLLQVATPAETEHSALLIVVLADDQAAERAARATLVVIKEQCEGFHLPIEVTVIDPANGRPSMLASAAAFYVSERRLQCN